MTSTVVQSFSNNVIFLLFEAEVGAEQQAKVKNWFTRRGASLIESPHDHRLYYGRNGIVAFGFPVRQPVIVVPTEKPTRSETALLWYCWRCIDGKMLEPYKFIRPPVRRFTWAQAVDEGRGAEHVDDPVLVCSSRQEALAYQQAQGGEASGSARRKDSEDPAAKDRRAAPRATHLPSSASAATSSSKRKRRDSAEQERPSPSARPKSRRSGKKTRWNRVESENESESSAKVQAAKGKGKEKARLPTPEPLFLPMESDDEVAPVELKQAPPSRPRSAPHVEPARESTPTPPSPGPTVSTAGDEPPREPTPTSPADDEEANAELAALLAQVETDHIEQYRSSLSSDCRMATRPFLKDGEWEDERVFLGVGVTLSDALLLDIAEVPLQTSIGKDTIVIVPIPSKSAVTGSQHRLYMRILACGGCQAVVSHEWIRDMILTNGRVSLVNYEVF